MLSRFVSPLSQYLVYICYLVYLSVLVLLILLVYVGASLIYILIYLVFEILSRTFMLMALRLFVSKSSIIKQHKHLKKMYPDVFQQDG